MSKITKVVKDNKKEADYQKLRPVQNFMGGTSYELNPLDTLKLIAASSIFGEAKYYRTSGITEYKSSVHSLVEDFALFLFDNKTATDVFTDAIDAALSYDYKGTLELALELRTDYFMRLNPQVIMVRAALHPDRQEFSENYPKKFREINLKVMSRADEPAVQLAYYIYIKGDKTKLPSILKRSWADRVSSMTAYEISKYKNAELGLINLVRVCHANSPLIDELMQTGSILVSEDLMTWENLRSQGKSWSEILSTINIPHMALLRNLRGIFTEIGDYTKRAEILKKLESGVLKGKQFPFRYMSAHNAIKESDLSHNQQILDSLENCIDISLANMPKLSGKVAVLSDNSGSAWGSFTSEFGTVKVAEIGNLSAVLTAMNSDQGYVYTFGDRLMDFPISSRQGALAQAEKISKESKSHVGQSTEHGIWLFLRDAIDNKKHWDTIFIYSDMQAGHGGLYGTQSSYSTKDGASFSVKNGSYIDVMKLINHYKKTVNPNVNVFMVQTAGYNNVLIPESFHRGAVLTGWTGKELSYAARIIDFWDEKQK